MSDFSPEFKEALAKEIEKMGTSLALASALQDQINGDGAPAMGAAAPKRRGRAVSGRTAAAGKDTKPTHKRVVTPEQQASRQLQGRYLGLIRQFPKGRRGEFQKIAKEKSRQAAIKAMQAAKAAGPVERRSRAKAAGKARTRTRVAKATKQASTSSAEPAQET